MQENRYPYIPTVLVTEVLTKQKLFKRYYFLPYQEAKATLNEIICKSRGLNKRTGSLKRILLVNEVQSFLESYDLLYTIRLTDSL